MSAANLPVTRRDLFRPAVRRLTPASLCVALGLVAACSSDGGSLPGGTGGEANPSAGGAANPSAGGAPSGGQSDVGGSPAAGGALTGGTSGAAGGSESSGGASAGGSSGGADAAGGSVGDGGTASGGADGSGGVDGSGGQTQEPTTPGCGKAFPTPPPKNQQQELQIQGDTRYYLLDVPQGADNKTPLMLIFGLHGYDMNNIAVVDRFNFTQRSGGKAITVWPQGEGPHPGNTSHWGDNVLLSTWSANAKNYEFLETIINELGDKYCIDRTRIFIAGFSMGGFFTNQIACDRSDWFRAFAPVAGGGPNGCANNSVKSAIMLQHGTQDNIVAISSGESSRDFWVGKNGCSSSSTKSLNNCSFYDGCAEEKPVAWCTGNYDHYIPDEVAGNIWSFFSSF